MLQPQTISHNLRGRPSTERIEIANGRNTYVLASVPDRGVVGQLLISQPR